MGDRGRDDIVNIFLMETPSTSIRDLARRLLVEEGSRRAATDAPQGDLVNEKLRILMTRFAGADSFTALLRRAQVLAEMERPPPTPGENAAGDGALVAAHLLWLLVTFIGETLTLRLVRETWPDVVLDN